MNHVLIIDDEREIRQALEGILSEEGYAATSVATAAEAMTMLRDAEFDVALLDIWLPDRDGLDLLAEIRALNPEAAPEVIMISGHGTIEAAVRATKLGAFDFLEKPLGMERTLLVVQHALEARKLRSENQEFKRQLSQRAHITGDSIPAKALRQQIQLMAPTNGRVLIFGESGSGKELIARAIHEQSLRKDGVFLELNCAAIPEDSIESELFGYRNAAVPGGAKEKRGTLERANGGTLFLDEVGDMSLKTQSKVLRALDEQSFHPVGASQLVNVDVRVIAATNKDLEEEIARGNFREDLFYRLNVVPFFVPPLRHRQEDIPALARQFLRDFGKLYGRPRIEITEDALHALMQYHWPGNVRELKNVMERVVILNPGAVRVDRKHLPMLVYRAASRDSGGAGTLQQARESYEREYILRKLDEYQGNVSRTAESLGMERSHFYRKMKALGIQPAAKEA